MAQQTINIGSSVNKGDGDPLRTAFDKVNDNFDELYARAENTDGQTLTLVGNTLSISGGNSVALDISPVGDLQGSVFADDSTLLVDGVNGVIPANVLTGTINRSNIPVEYLRFPDPEVLVTIPTPTSTGTKGEVRYAAGFIYICVASNTWVRSQVETAWE
jgi:hypothetical protein